MRVRHGLLIAGVLFLALAANALATNLGAVLYAPPKITLVDQPMFGSIENVTVTRAGAEFSFAQGTGLVKHPDSEDGCTDNFSTDYRCPVAGIDKIVLQLGKFGDTASIDLGASAQTVKQILQGGSAGDTLSGGPGAQREFGEGGADTITGGPGPDLIDGGPGIDDCSGGPGRDTIRDCE